MKNIKRRVNKIEIATCYLYQKETGTFSLTNTRFKESRFKNFDRDTRYRSMVNQVTETSRLQSVFRVKEKNF